MTINNTGVIQSARDSIVAGETGVEKVTITNSADLGTTEDSSHAIHVNVNNGNAVSNGIEIVQNNSTLITQGYDSHGIYVRSTASSGDINITTSNTHMNLAGQNSDGIDVDLKGKTSSNVNITTHGGSIKTFDPTISGVAQSGANFGRV